MPEKQKNARPRGTDNVRIELEEGQTKLLLNGEPIQDRCVSFSLSKKGNQPAMLQLELICDEATIDGLAIAEGVPLRREQAGHMLDSFGFSPHDYNQIIVFSSEDAMKAVVAANPNMTAIIGADDHTKMNFPGVFLAGVKAMAQTDKLVNRPAATQTQYE